MNSETRLKLLTMLGVHIADVEGQGRGLFLDAFMAGAACADELGAMERAGTSDLDIARHVMNKINEGWRPPADPSKPT